MEHLVSRLLVVLAALELVQSLGEPCSPANDRLDPQTHQFHSDCSVKEYCATSSQVAVNPTTSSWAPVATAVPDDPDLTQLFRRADPMATTCQSRQCRQDEDPFGYDVEVDVLPPTCEDGEFCPDEGSGCLDLIPLGGACQLARDDQCVKPVTAANAGSAICLNYVCLWANATAGLPCKIENSVYSGYDANGTSIAFSEIVTRSTCLSPQLYCSPQSLVCGPAQPLGGICAADVECASGSCSSGGLCDSLDELPTIVPTSAYVISVCLLLAILCLTSYGLFVVHRRDRRSKAEAKKRLLEEQDRYRRAIAELGAAALLGPLTGPASIALTRSESYATSYTYGTGSSSRETQSFSGRSYAYEPSVSDTASDTLSSVSRRSYRRHY